MAAKYINISLVEPDYLVLADYEKNFPIDHWRKKFGVYAPLSAYASALYVLLVFGGRRFMNSREPFKLNKLLAIWNIGLAVMSIYAFLRMAPEFFTVLLGQNGIYHSICEWKEHNGATAFWSFVLLLSKLIEFGDTAFIVLRKQNLLFLHWYHHVTTLMSWWYMYYWYEPNQLLYCVMNSFVHSFMYSYYALRALKFRVPRNIAMAITTIQLSQMIIGVAANVYAFQRMWLISPDACPHRNWYGLKISLGIYVTFSILFTKLFIDSYARKKSATKKAD